MLARPQKKIVFSCTSLKETDILILQRLALILCWHACMHACTALHAMHLLLSHLGKWTASKPSSGLCMSKLQGALSILYRHIDQILQGGNVPPAGQCKNAATIDMGFFPSNPIDQRSHWSNVVCDLQKCALLFAPAP